MKYRYEAIVKIGPNENKIICHNVRELIKELKLSSAVIEKLIHKKENCFAKKWITINRFEIENNEVPKKPKKTIMVQKEQKIIVSNNEPELKIKIAQTDE